LRLRLGGKKEETLLSFEEGKKTLHDRTRKRTLHYGQTKKRSDKRKLCVLSKGGDRIQPWGFSSLIQKKSSNERTEGSPEEKRRQDPNARLKENWERRVIEDQREKKK